MPLLATTLPVAPMPVMDNPFQQDFKSQVMAAAQLLAPYDGALSIATLQQIANNYTAMVSARTLNQPPPLSFQQIIMDPNFQQAFAQATAIKPMPMTTSSGSSIGTQIVTSLVISGVLSGVGYLVYRWYKKRKSSVA